MIFIDGNTVRTELEAVIIGDDQLYRTFDEARLLNDGYTTEEMREIVVAWISAGDECGAA